MNSTFDAIQGATRAKKRPGRLKPCRNCGTPFWCAASNDIGGSQQERHSCSWECCWAYRSRPEVRLAIFWASVDKNAPGGCWLWTGWKLNSGYGDTSVNGRRITVHRFSYELANGPIPKGKLVLHRCDVPACVNPEHLFLGTDADNNHDMRAKGRARNGRQKLTPEQVRAIRAEYRYDATTRRSNAIALAERYGIDRSNISKIMTWSSRKDVL